MPFLSPWRVPSRPDSESPAAPRKVRKRTLTARSLPLLPLGEHSDAVVRGLVSARSSRRANGGRSDTGRGSEAGPGRNVGCMSAAIAVHSVSTSQRSGSTISRRRPSWGLRMRDALPAPYSGSLRVASTLSTCSSRRYAPPKPPSASRRAARTPARRLFVELVERYVEWRSDPPKDSDVEPLREASIANYNAIARAGLGDLAERDPATLAANGADVRAWHRAIAATGRRVYANRCLELVRAAFAWAASEDVGLLAASPAVGVKGFKEAPRQRALSSDELRAIWSTLDGELYGDALRLLAWTGARKTEALGAEWREIDFKARLWTVPASRSKTGLERKIPLSRPALAMLKGRREADARGRYVFPGQRGAGPVRTIQAVVERVQKRSGTSGWSLHDVRRTVRSGLSSIGTEPLVSEWILGHLKPALQRRYDVHEPIAKAETALDAWARRLASYVSGEAEDAAVVPFGKRA